MEVAKRRDSWLPVIAGLATVDMDSLPPYLAAELVALARERQRILADQQESRGQRR